MSWHFLEKTVEHINIYSTIFGKTWYLLVVVFRLIVVVTIGTKVYEDEQSQFKCSTKVVGCETVCYDRFAKISHIRFWSFQLLALAFPVVIFHFCTVFEKGRIEKLKEVQAKDTVDENKENEPTDGEPSAGTLRPGSKCEVVKQEVVRRRKKVGKVTVHRRYNNDKLELEDVDYTSKIHLFYFASSLARAVVEIVFLYLAYDLFRFAEHPYTPNDGRVVSDGRRVQNPIDIFWIRVPQLYRCTGMTVRWACQQHLLPGNLDSYVPCWVSRPWEKTIFLQYMNTLSVVCLFLCFLELIQLTIKFFKKRASRQKKKESGSVDEKEPSPPSYEHTALPDRTAQDEEKLSTKNEASSKESMQKSMSQPKLQTSPEKDSILLVDRETGKVNIGELKKLMKEVKKIPRKESIKPPTETKRKKRTIETVVEEDETKPKELERKPPRTRFQLPIGTQSLNRPKKVTKSPYSQLYHFSSGDSFSGDGGDPGGDESGSSDESDEIESVSAHSDNS